MKLFFVPAHSSGSLQTIGIRDSGGLLDAGAPRLCGGRGGRVPRRITASDFDLSFPSWKRKAPLPSVVLVFCCLKKKKNPLAQDANVPASRTHHWIVAAAPADASERALKVREGSGTLTGKRTFKRSFLCLLSGDLEQFCCVKAHRNRGGCS